MAMRIIICCILSIASSAQCMSAEPHWIWGHELGAANEPVRLKYTFRTDHATPRAVLSFAATSAAIRISLDGNEVGRCKPYSTIQRIELDQRLHSGDHELVVEGQGIDGPSAMFLELKLSHFDRNPRMVVSSSDWHCDGDADVKDFGAIDERWIVSEDRRVGINAVDNYEQWKQALGANEGADPASFWVAPGFEIQLVRSATEAEDSWVSLAIDPHGRLIVAKEQTGLLRMTLSPEGDEVTQVESVDETLKECRGLVFIGNDLYVNANNSKGLYRLRHQDDQFAKPELLFASSGGVGHGRNDLAVGPDGMLYSIHGDAVDLPLSAKVDYTSPFREARRGKKTSEGHLLRIDTTTGGVEILAAGLRNPFGIDFNGAGDIFTYDADAEYDMGAPWYRPTRVNHLITGADYGWRGVTKSWPPYYPDHPDNAPANLDIGKGSPTAVKFGSRSNFPRRYRDALFVLDWAYGRIIAVHTMPRGSSYTMTSETFLKGRPLNVTDIDFADDGSLYIVTGGRKTQSALYRVRYVGHLDDDALSKTAHEPTAMQAAVNEFARQSRDQRRRLESYLTMPQDVEQIEDAWQYLSNPDPLLRHTARNVLERYPIEMWKNRALGDSDPVASSVALLALARADRTDLYPEILQRLNQMQKRHDSSTSRLPAFYTYWLVLRSKADLDEQLRRATLEALEKEYPSESFDENRLLSEMLVDLSSDTVVSKTMRLLESATNPSEQMHYLFVLRNVRGPWTLDQRREYFAALAQATYFVGGAGMPDFLNKIREEAKASLSTVEKRELGTLTDPRQVAEQMQSKLPPRRFQKRWTTEDLLSGEQDAKPDLARGAMVFTAVCKQCHRFGTRGTPIGPDLTSAHRRFSRRDLLVSIIDPSNVIAENYRSLKVLTSDGKVYVGQASPGGDYRSPVLRMAIDPRNPFSITEISKTEIEAQEFSDVSWMPEGLLDAFRREEILDLIAFLQSSP